MKYICSTIALCFALNAYGQDTEELSQDTLADALRIRLSTLNDAGLKDNLLSNYGPIDIETGHLEELSLSLKSVDSMLNELDGLYESVTSLILAKEILLNRKINRLADALRCQGKPYESLRDIIGDSWPFSVQNLDQNSRYWTRLKLQVSDFLRNHRRTESIALSEITTDNSGIAIQERLDKLSGDFAPLKEDIKNKWFNEEHWTKTGVKTELLEEFVADIEEIDTTIANDEAAKKAAEKAKIDAVYEKTQEILRDAHEKEMAELQMMSEEERDSLESEDMQQQAELQDSEGDEIKSDETKTENE